MKRIYFILLALCILFACEKEKQTDPIIYNNSGIINSDGGIVIIEDGASVEIPPGALNTNQTISIVNTTHGDTVANSDCRIYELKPDGLIFSDSVLITLPFDNRFIDLNDQEINYGVGIMVFQDTTWIKLKTKVNLEEATVTAKTLHFSTYQVFFPGIYEDYFNIHRGTSKSIINIPYYFQGISMWCTYNSLSMLTKATGHYMHAPFYAALYNDSETQGFGGFDLFSINSKLNNLSIENEIAYPAWANAKNLCGYLLKQLDNGNPVLVLSGSLDHAFVVAGHDYSSFYINDPSGAFVHLLYPDLPYDQFALVDVPFEKFIEIVNNKDDYSDWVGFDTEYTIVLKETISPNIFLGTLNFPNFPYNVSSTGTAPKFDIYNKDKRPIGGLDRDGKYKPNGYFLLNSSNKNNSFDGSDYCEIIPDISNSDTKNTLIANLHYIIDGNDVSGSPVKLSDVPKGNTYFLPSSFKVPFSNLSAGDHTLTIKLESYNDPLKYDYWDFNFKINTPYILNKPTVSTNVVNNQSSNSATVGGNVTATGGADVTERGVYWGTSQNPETSGIKLQIGSGTGSFSTTLLGLELNTIYYIKAYAINSNGTGFGEQVSFKTLGNPPTAAFTASPTNITLGQSVQFTDQSTNSPTSWIWDFGDGSASTEQNPTHTYSTADTYTVILTVSNNVDSDNEIKADYITVIQGSDIVFNPNLTYGSVLDIDGNTYKTIQIGTQTWMAENLKTTKYDDGASIALVTDYSGWANLTSPAYCWHSNNENANKNTYGALYNWYTVNMGNLCPTDWHVPSIAEWNILTDYLGGLSDAGGKMKEIGNYHWLNENQGASNTSGFTALPSDYRGNDGIFHLIGDGCAWWSSIENSASTASAIGLSHSVSSAFVGSNNKKFGFSVRCVRDN
jgi:uncharacterized protein (TIGR02145 family)